MPTTIMLAGIAFTGTGVYTGFTYDKLTGWVGVEDVDLRMKKRPNQPGAFGVEKTDPPEKTISIEGQFFGADERSAELARELLTTIYADGREVTMSVSNDLRTTSRLVQIASIDIPWTPHKEFSFTIDMKARDPKRYGTPERVSNTLAVAGSGLEFETGVAVSTPFALVEDPAGSGAYRTTGLVEDPAGSGLYRTSGLTEDPAGSGLYLTTGGKVTGLAPGLGLDFGLDFGTTPNDGRIVVTNTGTSETTSTFFVRNGDMPDGAEIVNLATGERLTYVGPITAGTYLEFDPRVQAVFVNGTNPSGRYLPNPAWWTVAKGESLAIQFLARGPVTGTPLLEAVTSPAYY